MMYTTTPSNARPTAAGDKYLRSYLDMQATGSRRRAFIGWQCTGASTCLVIRPPPSYRKIPQTRCQRWSQLVSRQEMNKLVYTAWGAEPVQLEWTEWRCTLKLLSLNVIENIGGASQHCLYRENHLFNVTSAKV